MLIRSPISWIMGKIEPEYLELFALEFGKIVESDFVYSLAFTNINKAALNLVKMCVTIRSQISLIMDLIGPELSELLPWNLQRLLNLTVYALASANVDLLVPKIVTIYTGFFLAHLSTKCSW